MVSSWPVDGHLCPGSSHGIVSSVPVLGRGRGQVTVFSSYKDTSPIRSGPRPVTSFNLNYLLKVLFPNTVTLGLRALPRELGEKHGSIHCRCHWRWLGGAGVGLACRKLCLAAKGKMGKSRQVWKLDQLLSGVRGAA